MKTQYLVQHSGSDAGVPRSVADSRTLSPMRRSSSLLEDIVDAGGGRKARVEAKLHAGEEKESRSKENRYK